MLNEHAKVGIAQIAFFAPAVIAAAALLFFRRPLRELPRYLWIVLLVFTLIRLVGGIVVILYENNPSSTGLLVATLVLLNVGVIPCIAATIGLINIIIYVDFQDNKILGKVIVCSRVLFIAGIGLLIAGGCLEGDTSNSNSTKTGVSLVRAGYCVVTAFVACLLIFQAFFWLRKSQLSRTSTLVSCLFFFSSSFISKPRILKFTTVINSIALVLISIISQVLRAASLAMPFFIIRLTYAFLSIYRSDRTWNSLIGPVAPFILMALLMEYCVVLIYLYTGFRIESPKMDSSTNYSAEMET